MFSTPPNTIKEIEDIENTNHESYKIQYKYKVYGDSTLLVINVSKFLLGILDKFCIYSNLLYVISNFKERTTVLGHFP